MLMKERQSLGLDMRVQDADGNEVDIKQNYDDDDMEMCIRDRRITCRL